MVLKVHSDWLVNSEYPLPFLSNLGKNGVPFASMESEETIQINILW